MKKPTNLNWAYCGNWLYHDKYGFLMKNNILSHFLHSRIWKIFVMLELKYLICVIGLKRINNNSILFCNSLNISRKLNWHTHKKKNTMKYTMKIQTERITQWFSPCMYSQSLLKFLIWTRDVICLRNWTAFPSKCMCKTCPCTVYLQIWDEFAKLVHNTSHVLSLLFWAVICCKPPPGSPDLAVGSHHPHHLWSAVCSSLLLLDTFTCLPLSSLRHFSGRCRCMWPMPGFSWWSCLCQLHEIASFLIPPPPPHPPFFFFF